LPPSAAVRNAQRARVAALAVSPPAAGSEQQLAESGAHGMSARIALERLYAAAEGDHWRQRSRWLTGGVCRWHGISCEHGEVVTIVRAPQLEVATALLLADLRDLSVRRTSVATTSAYVVRCPLSSAT
jgi:hypothetical protein